MIPYTASQILYEEYGDDVEEVADKLTGTWRHGTKHRRVVRWQESLWAIDYRATSDDGYDDETFAGPYEVEAREVVKIEYVRKPNAAA